MNSSSSSSPTTTTTTTITTISGHPSHTHIEHDSEPTTESNGFNTNASPPLILAFLSIGLFACSMIGVLGWRRIQQARNSRNGHGHGRGMRTYRRRDDRPPDPDMLVTLGIDVPRPRKKREVFGEVPKFWDVCAIMAGGGGEYHHHHHQRMGPSLIEGWESLMPISVTIFDGGKILGDVNLERTLNVDDRELNEKTVDLFVVPEDRIHVAVAIAMPAPCSSSLRARTKLYDSEQGRIDPVVYTLGVYDRPWKREEG